MKKLCIYPLILSIVVSGCSLSGIQEDVQTTVSASDIQALQTAFMSSYYAERGGSPAGISLLF